MAADVYGTAHLFGVSGTLSNVTVTDASFEEVCANVAKVLNESGNQIERRYDDREISGSLTLIQRTSFTVPTAGDTLVYETVTYELTKVGRKQNQSAHRIVEVSLVKSEGITYA